MNNLADQNFSTSSIPTESPSSPRESVSRFKARCIRVKMMYFNKDSARLLVALIGVILVGFQRQTFMGQTDIKFYWNPPYLFEISTIIFSVLSGILSYIYPPQNILLISILSSSVLHLVNPVLLDGFNIKIGSNSFLGFLQITVFATTLPAFHGIWASVFHKSLVLSLPIVLYSIHDLNMSDPLNIFGLVRFFNSYILVMVSLTWCAVWMYINKNFKPNEDVSSSMKMSSANKATLSTIPWKSMCTSIPVLVIMINYVCEVITHTQLTEDKNGFYWFYSNRLLYQEWKLFLIRIAVYVTMIFTLIVLEFYPEVRFTSTIKVRKVSTVSYYFCNWMFRFFYPTFLTYGIFYTGNTLYTFGYIVNHMDIAPRYASILCGFIRPIQFFTRHLIRFTIFTITYSSSGFEWIVFGVIILFYVTVVICYSIFASAEIQPWAKTDEDGNQQEFETIPVTV